MSEGAVTWTVGGDLRELDEANARRALAAALAHGGQPDLRVDLVFVDDATLARMHGEYLGDPSPTDVITFDLRGDEPEDAGGPDAEIYVSVDRARAVAVERATSVESELTLYVVHGALHLVGFDDREDDARAEMRDAERSVLGTLGR